MASGSATIDARGTAASLPMLRVEGQKLYHGSIIPRQEYVHPPMRDLSFGSGAYFTESPEIARLYATTGRDTYAWDDFKERLEVALKGGKEKPTVYEVTVSGAFLDLRDGDKQLVEFLRANIRELRALYDEMSAEGRLSVVPRDYGKYVMYRLKGEFANDPFETIPNSTELAHELREVLTTFLARHGFVGRIDRALEEFYGRSANFTQWVVFNPLDAKIVTEAPIESILQTN